MFSEFNSHWPWENKLEENFSCNPALGSFFFFFNLSFKFKHDKIKKFMSYH